jgi:hypothetical protein
MRSYVILSVGLLLSCAVWAGDAPVDVQSSRLTRLSTNESVNGFILVASDIRPFSPVVDVEFNLPMSSTVDVFFTDTLMADTTWICRNETLGAGQYLVAHDAIAELGRSKDYRTFVAHLSANSTYGDNTCCPVDCSFVTQRRLAFR